VWITFPFDDIKQKVGAKKETMRYHVALFAGDTDDHHHYCGAATTSAVDR